MVQVASAGVGRCQHQHAAPLKRTQMRKIVVSLDYWKKCCKMNKTTYFYPKFLDLDSVSRAANDAFEGREFETPSLECSRTRLWKNSAADNAPTHPLARLAPCNLIYVASYAATSAHE